MKNTIKKSSRKTRRNFIKRHPFVSSLIGSLSLATLVYFYNPSFLNSKVEETALSDKNINDDYLNVRSNNDQFLRQHYIDEIINRHGIVDGVSSVIYENRDGPYIALSRGKSSMQTFFYVPEKYKGADLETSIVIYSTAFENASSEDEFLSLLIDHEYCHTDLVRGRVKLEFSSEQEFNLLNEEINRRLIDVNEDLFNLFHELYSYDRQIGKFSDRTNLSDKFRRNIISMYNSCVDSLYNMDETNLVKYLKEKYKKKIYF